MAKAAVDLSTASDNYNHCKHYQPKKKDCATYVAPFGFVSRVGKFLERHSGTLTALSSIAVAVFTYTLWQTSSEQAALTRESIDLARDEFIASHRPRVRIRRIVLTRLSANKPAEVNIEAANVGESEGTIVGIGLDVFTDKSSFSAATKEVSSLAPISPGKQASMNGQGSLPLTRTQAVNIHTGATQLYCLGIILYKDRNRTVRTTSFARKYDHTRQCFVVDEAEVDRDYED